MIVIHSNYTTKSTDCYIGVNSEDSVTVTLSNNYTNGHKLTVKTEYGSPVGNRKVKITTINEGNALRASIDGSYTYTMSTPWEYIQLLFHDTNWYII